MLSWAWQYLSGDPNAAIISLSLHPVIMPAVFTLCSIVTAAPWCCILTLQQCRIKCSCKPLQSVSALQVFTQLCHCSCSRHRVNTIVLFMQNISPFLDWAHKDRSPVPGQVTYNHDLVLVKHWIYHASLILLELGMGSHKTETSKDPRHPVFSACSSFPRLQHRVASVHLTLCILTRPVFFSLFVMSGVTAWHRDTCQPGTGI